ncbi:hypothetical protein KR009_003880 [Drosophila setifemur]|nr:hypothetical protein KR009_003880 [Drosophila setifemur]
MVTRACVYKDCEYYYSVHDTKGRTLFAFPKNTERARIWHENGKVHPKIPPNQLYMCSQHFDPAFISASKSRTLLVGEAIPYPYPKRDPDGDPEPDAESEEAFQQVASTSSQGNYYINLSDDELSINTVGSTTKSKASEGDLQLPTPKRAKDSVNIISLAKTKHPLPADHAPDNVGSIDTSEVSVFNFKGHEYVQMSLVYYLKEKHQMAAMLKEYKNTLRNIKAQVSRLDV